MRFSGLFVLVAIIGLAAGGIAAASGSRHRGNRLLASSPTQQICPNDPAVPLVEPEARDVMNVDAAQQIANGSGIKVGIIADGIDVNLPDLIRTGGQHVVFDYQDFSGFGTNAPTDGRQAFLAAGIIASQGRQTYDLSGFVNPAHPLPPGCNIRIKGIAPGSSLAVLDVAGSNPRALRSQTAQAIRYAVNVDQVDVLDEPFVANPIPDTQDDPVSLANQAAVAAGVVIVVGSGDAGPFDNIGAPATSPDVISVGGTTTYRLYRQTTSYGAQLSSGGWENDNISALSSSGITASYPGTVSVVAPADSGWSLCGSDTTAFFGCADIDSGSNPPPIFGANSTGASAAATSATAALVLQAYAQTHAGSLPSPALVKRIIVSTATDLGAPAEHQGAGLVNALKAVQLAESIGSSPQGSTLLVSQPALSATVKAGHNHDFGVKITNEKLGSDGHPNRFRTPDDARDRHWCDHAELRLADPHRRRGSHRLLRGAPVHRAVRSRQPERRHHLECASDRRRGLRDPARHERRRRGLFVPRHQPEWVRTCRGAASGNGHLDCFHLHGEQRSLLRVGEVRVFQ